jgi:hypothetical protein
MKDWPHSQIMFGRAEGVFHLRELDVSAPQDFRIGLPPVGSQKVTAAGFHGPLIPFFISLDIDIAQNLAMLHKESRNANQ